MRVLFIGNYADESGWAQFAERQILALDAAGVDVTARRIKLNGAQGQVPERLLELEDKKGGDFDVVIQNVLPHFSEYTGKVAKNIVYYMCETSNFISSTWTSHINLMDEGWVPSTHNKIASLTSGVERPIKVIPTAVDLKQFDSPPTPFPLRDVFKDDFIFYTIGEFTTRKNMGALLKAFHLEFDKSEPVQLLIKTSQGKENIQNFINNIKIGLKLSPSLNDFKQEIVVTDHLSREDIKRIHTTGDCFVSTSRGEAVCLPALDAMGFGKPVVVPRHTGFLEYLNDNRAFLIDTYEDSVFGAHDTFGDLLTGREEWFETSVPSLRKGMRAAYEGKAFCESKVANAKRHLLNLSYEKVGQVMKEALLDNV